MIKVKIEVGNASKPSIPTKHLGAARCLRPICPACKLGKQHRRTSESSSTLTNPEKEMAIKRDNIHPGDCVSMDQYQCKVPGRLSHTFGKEPTETRYNGGTIFSDHASQFVFLNNQVSLRVVKHCKANMHLRNLQVNMESSLRVYMRTTPHLQLPNFWKIFYYKIKPSRSVELVHIMQTELQNEPSRQ